MNTGPRDSSARRNRRAGGVFGRTSPLVVDRVVGEPVGAPLARLEGEVAFRGLTSRFPGLSLVDHDPEYRANPVLRGLKRLDLAIA